MLYAVAMQPQLISIVINASVLVLHGDKHQYCVLYVAPLHVVCVSCRWLTCKPSW
jgi:hypothetical protein